MMSKNDGGAAFPNTPTDRSGQIAEHECGMSLRDYFAAKAMQGYIASVGYDGDSESNIAFNAYKQADAMLKERDK